MSENPVISLDNVTKIYPGAQAPAVSDFSFSVQPNEIVCLLGPNGSGKTTTIEMIAGLLQPTSGSVLTLGVDPLKNRELIRNNVAVQPQHAALFENQTVGEIVTFWRALYSKGHSPDHVIEQLGLGDCRNVRIPRLSGGQRQRVLLALALVSQPSVLVLDEPSTGLDPNAKQELWNAIRLARESGATVLLSTHDMQEAEELNDKVALFSQGKLVAFDSSSQLISKYASDLVITAKIPASVNSELLKSCGEEVSIVPNPDGTIGVEIQTNDGDACFRALSDLGAFNLRTHDSGLAGVFQKLTGDEWSSTNDE